MKVIRDAIRDAILTKTEVIIANYVMDHYAEVCFMTSTDVALNVGVSESSVIRFCRALGFKGYMDFRKYLQNNYQKKVKNISSSITVPAERLESRLALGNEDRYIEVHFENALSNLKSAIVNNPQALFDKAADIIINSQEKYIVSSRANTGQGDYLLLLMKHMVDNVSSSSHGAVNVIDHICGINKNDCVILFSFPRYSQLDKLAMELALEAEAKIIIITDKQSSLLARYATVLFTVDVNSNTFFNSYIGVQFVTEALCSAISRKIGEPVAERLKKVDKYLEPLGVY